MTYKELVRLATEPGPMQELAIQALAEEFAADDRADYGPIGHNEQFDIMRFAPEYVDARLAAPRSGVPMGDMSREEEDESIRGRAGRELVAMYDRQYPESMLDTAKGALSQFGGYITSPEGVMDTAQMAADSFLPAYSQMDSLKWADEAMQNYHAANERGDPLSGLMFLPQAGIGYIGSIPGLSSVVAGGRKLGLGARTVYEGLF